MMSLGTADQQSPLTQTRCAMYQGKKIRGAVGRQSRDEHTHPRAVPYGLTEANVEGGRERGSEALIERDERRTGTVQGGPSERLSLMTLFSLNIFSILEILLL